MKDEQTEADFIAQVDRSKRRWCGAYKPSETTKGLEIIAMAKRKLLRLTQRLIPSSLEGRLRGVSLLLIMLPSILFIVFFASYQLNNERQKVLTALEHGASLRRHHITNWALNKGIKIKTLAAANNARNVDKATMAIDFQSALSADDKFSSFIFVNSSGQPELTVPEVAATDVFNKNYFKKAVAGEAAIADIDVDEVSRQWQVVFAAPVYSFTGEFNGAILGIMPLSSLDSVVGALGFGKTGDTYLLSSTGVRLTVPRFAVEQGIEPESTECYLKPVNVKALFSGNSGIQGYQNCRGQKVIGVSQPIAELGWSIVSEIDEEEVLEPVYHVLLNMITIFLVVLLAVLPLTVLLTNTIKQPIECLLSGAESIRQLDYSYYINRKMINNAPYELKRLCGTFNRMAATIRSHRNTLEEKISERTRALIQAVIKLENQVSARRQIELSLLQSEEKYRMLFDRANDAIMINDLDDNQRLGRFIEVNDRACQLLGYTRNELLELTPFDIDVKLAAGNDLIIARLSANQSIVLESELIGKTGEAIPVEMNFHKIIFGDKNVGFAIIRDISLRRKMEQEMSHMERLNLVGEMAASIGHEVRNPMTTVRGFLQMLGRKETSANAEYFKLMIEELDRANDIITEFLSLAKNKAMNLKSHNLNNIITAIYPLLKADAIIGNKTVELELNPISNLNVDEKEIRQLILNLVRNGLEAMPAHTKLIIKTYLDENEVVLTVQDEGSGIPAEILAKLGTPFVTTKEKGTGLGLPICFSIARRHNATIKPESSQEGTTFYVRFKI